MKRKEISNDEIRECAIRLMEQAGTLDSGADYRQLRDYEDETVSIIRGLLAGEYKPKDEGT